MIGAERFGPSSFFCHITAANFVEGNEQKELVCLSPIWGLDLPVKKGLTSGVSAYHEGSLKMSEDFGLHQERVHGAVKDAVLAQARAREKGEQTDLAQRAASLVVGGTVEGADEPYREVFGEEPPLVLTVFDADKIQSWVFDTNRPPVIGGASHLLDDLGKKLRDPGFLGIEGRGGIVYSGGGTGLAITAAADAEALKKRIGEAFGDVCPGLSVSVASVSVRPSDLVGGTRKTREVAGFGARFTETGGLAATMTRLHARLRDVKDGTLPAVEVLEPEAGKGRGAHDREGRCHACFVRRAKEEVDRPEGRTLPLCTPCHTRWTSWQDRVSSKRARGLSFQDIAEASESKRRYLAVLKADGNSMGRVFQLCDRLDRLAALSSETTRIYEEARNSLVEPLQLVDRHGDPRYLSLLTGGDEVVLLLPGDRGLRAARAVLKTIQERTVESLEKGLLAEAFAGEEVHLRRIRERLQQTSAGLGLIIASPKLPIRHLIEMVKELETSAKTLKPLSGVDFEVLTGGSMLPVSVERQRAASRTSFGMRRTSKPYNLADFEELLSCMVSSKDVPRSQLYQLREGLADGREVFLNHALYQIARNKKLLNWARKHGHETLDEQGAVSPGKIENWLVPKVKDRPYDSRTWLEDLIEMKDLDFETEAR